MREGKGDNPATFCDRAFKVLGRKRAKEEAPLFHTEVRLSIFFIHFPFVFHFLPLFSPRMLQEGGPSALWFGGLKAGSEEYRTNMQCVCCCCCVRFAA